jgi:uncharacterized Zn-finger protein
MKPIMDNIQIKQEPDVPCVPCVIVCPLCRGNYPDKRALNDHLRDDHKLDRCQRHYCPKCNKSYARKEHLVRHELNEHGIFATPSICEICFKVFKNKKNLENHTYKVHNIRLSDLMNPPTEMQLQ